VTFSRQIEYQSQAVELTTKRLQAMKAATLIKMLLITPKEKYDPSLGWNLLTTFDEAIIVAAIGELLQFETVIKISAVTKGNERKIPGRAYQLSSRFWEILGGPLSGKLGFQALQFWKSLLVGFEKEDQVKLPLLKLDGTMAVLMELLASPFYTISFDLDKVDEELHNTEPLYLKRIENGTLNRQNSFDIPEPNLDGDSERILASISSHSGLSVNQLKQCLDTIAEAKELGCAIQDLHRSLPGDTLFLQFEMALKQLVKAKMISRVGFDEIRYVSPEFVSAWQMNLPFENNELQYLPRLWTSPSGTKSDSIYRTCFDSVLSRIVVQPGVSKVSLINKDDLLAMVSVVFSRVDLEMILEDMIQKGTIEERIYQKQKCTSFVDGLFGSVTDQLIQPFDLFNAKISSFPQDLIHLYFPSESWFKSK
jgi:hypothetical protein